MCYPDDLCASVTSASSPTVIALTWALCALSYCQQQQVSRDQLAVLHLHAQCGNVRNAAVPWSYWNDSPRFSCGSVPLPRTSPSNHENDLSQLDFFAPSGAVARCVPVRGLSHTYPHEFPGCSLPCFIHFATPTPPTSCFPSPSFRLGSIQNA